MGMITEENVAKYKIDVMNKVDDILINLDKHKYDKQYTTTNKEIYPIVVTTLVDNDDHGDVYHGGSTSGDLWDTFLDDLSREEDLMCIDLDSYHELLKIKAYEYDHEMQVKLIELHCFVYSMDWDFTHKVWEIE
jgi:hypothetical protein